MLCQYYANTLEERCWSRQLRWMEQEEQKGSNLDDPGLCEIWAVVFTHSDYHVDAAEEPWGSQYYDQDNQLLPKQTIFVSWLCE